MADEATDDADDIARQTAAAAADETPPPDLEAQLAAEKDRVLRLQAEMQNLRNRLSREIADERRYAALPVLRDLLPVVDNIDRAIAHAEKQSDAKSLLDGFKLVRQQLAAILEQHNVQPIPALGEQFNPDVHQAILTQPSEEHPENHVALVTQEGYQLHDRVVRPSQVIVSSGPAGGN